MINENGESSEDPERRWSSRAEKMILHYLCKFSMTNYRTKKIFTSGIQPRSKVKAKIQ
jgi:hypothetical protein